MERKRYYQGSRIIITSKHVNKAPYDTHQSAFIIIQITDVPASISLYNVLNKISDKVRSIVGIGRAADYNEKILGESIYLYCVDKEEAEYLETIELEFAGVTTQAKIVDLSIGKSIAPVSKYDREMRGVPTSIMLRKLARTQKAHLIHYLAELTRYFERSVITVIRLGYEERRHQSQGFGFVTFLRRTTALEIGAQKHTIIRHEITTEISENIPVLIDPRFAGSFKEGLRWGRDVEALNRLTAQLKSAAQHCILADAIRTKKHENKKRRIVRFAEPAEEDTVVIENDVQLE